jgi:hypothetical protein
MNKLTTRGKHRDDVVGDAPVELKLFPFTRFRVKHVLASFEPVWSAIEVVKAEFETGRRGVPNGTKRMIFADDEQPLRPQPVGFGLMKPMDGMLYIANISVVPQASVTRESGPVCFGVDGGDTGDEDDPPGAASARLQALGLVHRRGLEIREKVDQRLCRDWLL